MLALALVASIAPTVLARAALSVPTPDGSSVDLTKLGRPEDPHHEMERLLQQVERRQREIDGFLERARDAARARPGEIAEHLKASETRSRDVVNDIDRILELAGHAHSGTGT